MRQMLIRSLFLLSLTVSGYALPVLIVGKPVELEVHNGHFTFPDGYVQRRSDYHFIKISNTQRICYLHEKPELSALPVLYVIIEEQDLEIRWVCYRYDPKYFELDY